MTCSSIWAPATAAFACKHAWPMAPPRGAWKLMRRKWRSFAPTWLPLTLQVTQVATYTFVPAYVYIAGVGTNRAGCFLVGGGGGNKNLNRVDRLLITS